MNIIAETLHVLEYVAAFTIFFFGTFFAINKMGKCTKMDMRCAWVLLTGGAMAVFLWPAVAHTLTLTGVALFVVSDKRRCWECHLQQMKVTWMKRK